MPPIALAQLPPVSLRVEAMVVPGAVRVGRTRPSIAGPRLLDPERTSMLPARKFRLLATEMMFFASFGSVIVEGPWAPELPAEKTWMKGSATAGVSRLPSRTRRSSSAASAT